LSGLAALQILIVALKTLRLALNWRFEKTPRVS